MLYNLNGSMMILLIRINNQDIDLLTCTDLSKKCFEPLIKHYKMEVASQDDFTK